MQSTVRLDAVWVCVMKKDVCQRKSLKELDALLKQAGPCVHTVLSMFTDTYSCVECLLNCIPLITIKYAFLNFII